MKKTIIIWLVIVGILLTFGVVFSKWDNVPKVDQKQVFIEKWTKIGEYKFEEIEAEKKREEAKKKKDELLQELQGSGSFQ